MDTLQRLINERPSFHKGETEITRSFDATESMLSQKEIDKLSSNELTCYGIGKDVLTFISENVKPGTKTLETGAGCSTLVFAFCGAHHTAVTPAQTEIDLITQYAAQNSIPLENVVFAAESSDTFLPKNTVNNLDMVLLDGKHAFPWPIIDWFYTADKLKQSGLMIVDDCEMKSVSILVDFMKNDSGWELMANFSGKTIVFKKTRVLTHDVAWHMQKYTVANPIQRIGNRIRNAIKL